ncbi:MAG: formate dehydrogenase accessory sulfurtransferase FdhD [Candidatus Altiarchaeum hamiconexum]|uniref:Sulfur carrier protein FdhD n=1 Tax=Candidatus Altarchaeum hamiconexum TaxID=1803513 RepID=A0A8J8CEI8_9ARCH|nr:formate dehydrogenase accessory sulfurtransferase FdhD [Candidatus Altarchaeum hamiconexum]OIQ05102.1 MAG: formate dehydrogenase family accessory protein FdhD [Candidatus Altarchaeum sp. CG2_30_32_3053]PIV27484.1 MAG: formate dehydrogenase family accessory protein FdhD [Candidatus Altarchaeum sp. CG03_land_8_20_14_0_80_32_618]PJC15042.1 MAG: formate dehydrogenase family accessory protein FdhD [Candidatus Altarchaeum sp. CG_4_9_14_0_8_um_filter_32_206]NCN68576.1 formate dehydrogenase accessor
MYEKFKIIRVEGKNFTTIMDDVVVEKNLKLDINNKFIADLSCSPGYEEELAIGLCVGEGILEKDAIKKILTENNNVKIYTDDTDFSQKVALYFSSDCMGRLRPRKIIKGKENYDVTVQDIVVSSDLSVTPEKIIAGMKKMHEKAEIWKKTGGMHIAGLMFGENLDEFIAIEDISRHVAADKVFGYGIINNINFADSILFTSGRLPADIIAKISRLGIPVAVTRTAVTYSAIKVAENTNVTLIGFARGNKFNIYVHPKRITND